MKYIPTSNQEFVLALDSVVTQATERNEPCELLFNGFYVEVQPNITHFEEHLIRYQYDLTKRPNAFIGNDCKTFTLIECQNNYEFLDQLWENLVTFSAQQFSRLTQVIHLGLPAFILDKSNSDVDPKYIWVLACNEDSHTIQLGQFYLQLSVGMHEGVFKLGYEITKDKPKIENNHDDNVLKFRPIEASEDIILELILLHLEHVLRSKIQK